MLYNPFGHNILLLCPYQDDRLVNWPVASRKCAPHSPRSWIDSRSFVNEGALPTCIPEFTKAAAVGPCCYALDRQSTEK